MFPVVTQLHESPPTRVAAAWLDAPQRQFEVLRPQKSAKVASQSTAELGAHSSSSTSSAYARTTWVDDNDEAWTMENSAHGPCWLNLSTQHYQWHPPWEC